MGQNILDEFYEKYEMPLDGADRHQRKLCPTPFQILRPETRLEVVCDDDISLQQIVICVTAVALSPCTRSRLCAVDGKDDRSRKTILILRLILPGSKVYVSNNDGKSRELRKEMIKV